jgi:hypothetical protein
MTLLSTHPDRAAIRTRLQSNIVLRRLKKRTFDELDSALSIVECKKARTRWNSTS